ncbi:MAG: alpha/beta fold hydrolase [Thermoguttaceae bacterium]
MRKIQRDSYDLAFEQIGEQGPVLLCVHGFPFDHAMWKPAIAALQQISPFPFRAILPDLRGFGQSRMRCDSPISPLSNPTSTIQSNSLSKTSIRQFADDLLGLLDSLEISEPIVLCGLSMGGYICMEFMRTDSGRVSQLILCDTRTAPDSPEVASNRLKTADSVLKEGLGPLVEGMLPKLFCEKSWREKPDLVAQTRLQMLQHDPAGIAAASRGMSERGDSTPLLTRLTLPVLVLCGEQDMISTPQEMREIAKKAKGDFVLIPDAGHLSPVENPEFWADCLSKFLFAPK